MKYGVAAQLEAGHVDELKYVKMPVPKPVANNPAIYIEQHTPTRR